MNILDTARAAVRHIMKTVAIVLNKLSGGKISPNFVTLTSLLAHIPIAVFIAYDKHELAAVLLIVFGLFDTLDGELARLQKRASSRGMVLDATSDRFKEVILYSGAAYSLVLNSRPFMAVWAVLACGASLSVSYVKAKGETAVKDSNLSPSEINRLFADGFLRFEIRMAILVFGLLFSQLAIAIVVIAVLSTFTALGRLIRIMEKL